ncbi:hypothetical protein SLEP1_g45418 [Rubroshorea leprosula]|uniref:Oligopeptide transporter n=1 Tax=Rubroshorea leprosula TaxID=152421 RepID=A0AAV5LKM9_9ROSI|nr:hypothetical protein SLEP1_g45418 [Rubroshorea leprosula]
MDVKGEAAAAMEVEGDAVIPVDKDGRGNGEVYNDNPIEEVRLTVPITDDPSEPALTFRTWFLGLLSCCILSSLNQFFSYRQNVLSVSSVSAQIISLPLGKLMAAVLPTTKLRFPFTNFSFSLNPGPFTMKEHALITIFADCGAGGVYAIYIVGIVKAFYRRKLHPIPAMLLAQTTQLLGYGWAGLFRKYLVESPYMWWPGLLVQVSLFRALHEKERRPKGGLSRLQFFLIVFISSFAYYVIPGFLFPSISALSFVCWIWKDSLTAQMVGSGLRGFGIGSFGLDWSTVAYIGSPLPNPLVTIVNTMVGFFLVFYILIPILYSRNAYESRRFPLLSSHTFDLQGNTYNISRILKSKTFEFDQAEYDNYSKLYMSITFAVVYGLQFATLAASLSHVALYYGKTTWDMWKKTTAAAKEKWSDVHARIMRNNYKAVPQWWFLVVLISTIALALFACEGFDKQLQLPWWGLLLACSLSLFFTLPVGIIQATTNMQPGLNVITELVIGYLYPGKPLANVTFKTYGYISMAQALFLISDFKLGHYMKIPPRSMFIVQLVGTIVASSTCFGTAWYLLSNVENICHPSLLPEGSPWTCPNDDVFYNASIIWGIIGPLRMFTKYGIYPELNWFFLIGAISPFPVWWLSRKYPEKKWINLIHMPLIMAGASGLPSAKAVHYIMWASVGIFFNWYIYNKYKGWWARYTYILSAALDAGVAFMGVTLFFALQSYDINGPDWWGLEATDHCPLASCPTAPGIRVEGCPVL